MSRASFATACLRAPRAPSPISAAALDSRFGPMSQKRRNRPWFRPDSLLFLGLLLLVLWLPLPWGSHSPWAISTAGVATFTLLAIWSVLAMMGKTGLSHRTGALAVPLMLWVAWLLWIGFQTF